MYSLHVGLLCHTSAADDEQCQLKNPGECVDAKKSGADSLVLATCAVGARMTRKHVVSSNQGGEDYDPYCVYHQSSESRNRDHIGRHMPSPAIYFECRHISRLCCQLPNNVTSRKQPLNGVGCLHTTCVACQPQTTGVAENVARRRLSVNQLGD